MNHASTRLATPIARCCASSLGVAAATLAVTATAVAQSGPSIITEADVVRPGDIYVVQGEQWFVGSGCRRHVDVSRREGHGVPLGRARVRDNGTFTFTRRVPRDAEHGPVVLDVTQVCDGIGTTRTVRFRVGKSRRTCPGHIAVDGRAYIVAVHGGVRCRKGAEAIGAFIDTDIEPAGWLCAHASRKIAGHDFSCVEAERPGRRVTARRIREV